MSENTRFIEQTGQRGKNKNSTAKDKHDGYSTKWHKKRAEKSIKNNAQG